jgi:hypothetical protein
MIKQDNDVKEQATSFEKDLIMYLVNGKLLLFFQGELTEEDGRE